LAKSDNESVFERFDLSAQAAFHGAMRVAREFGHDYLGTEHLLVSLTETPDGEASAAFSAAGLDAERARSALHAAVGLGAKTEGQIPFTPALKHLLEDAARAAEPPAKISDIHLALAVLERTDDVVKRILAVTRPNREVLRQMLLGEPLGVVDDPNWAQIREAISMRMRDLDAWLVAAERREEVISVISRSPGWESAIEAIARTLQLSSTQAEQILHLGLGRLTVESVERMRQERRDLQMRLEGPLPGEPHDEASD
jgi:ATP-dependent Clp protease ATP-binding subunit ClpA